MSIICHGGASGFKLEQLEIIEKKYSNNPILSKIRFFYEEGIRKAIEAGKELLDNGYDADKIVVKVISILENNELFNAGRGCCLTENGKIELDSFIMDNNKNFGAITLGTNIKNPIIFANKIKNEFGMKMLGGEALNKWIKHFEIETKDQEYFISENKDIINNEIRNVLKDIKYSTVGCVVKDKMGQFSAGTSTGGVINKQWGRIGDSPIIGCGTYVEPHFGAISCTGTGEKFMKECIAYDILCQIKYVNKKMLDAMTFSINKLPEKSGGCIGIDNNGKCYAFFNSKSMFYGYLENGKIYYGLENILV